MDHQLEFASLSGDHNPLHVDPVASRRLLFGGPVVHGIHSVLWVLDRAMQEESSECEITRVRAMFHKPLLVGDEVVATIERSSDSIQAELVSNGAVALTLKAETGNRRDQNSCSPKNEIPERAVPTELDDEKIATTSGVMNLYLQDELARKLFPKLATLIPAQQLSTVSTCSRLVGGECPGMHSVFAELQLTFDREPEAPLLKYSVKRYNGAIGMVSMELEGPGCHGDIRAFRRPSPKQQPSISEIAKLVSKDEFANQRALVIGGSRGMGEIAVKMLAAGGADVSFTYNMGKEDAVRICNDVESAGARVRRFQYNVLSESYQPDDPQDANYRASHIYYFATPFVFGGNKGVFVNELFDKFCRFYVNGFVNALEQFREPEQCAVLYPSTVAIDELPVNMGEYVAAKTAGEALVSFLKKSDRTLSVHCPRLPRVATDQTVSLVPVKNGDPVEILLKEIRALQALDSSN
ncbi:short chain dehydrogenase [Thalassoglobus neptunius]|uniref:Short chain dehydrogenase n=1 Tax=Thalassoglobus neptunius TaxID=1938619 RepID=A0A5C5WM71_9PLAN|nr:MaoC/PaaZ C-terminal domain-containing protein [Thalassoglobus neptunius]TWT51710.1 short chain dehydrogenase [Thalassoglobus neptunius]